MLIEAAPSEVVFVCDDSTFGAAHSPMVNLCERPLCVSEL
jgi:hypothetical protein